MKKKKCLITGVTGFVGSWMAEYLLEKDQEVWGAKRWRSPMDNVSQIANQIKFVDWDLTDAVSAKNIIEEVKPDVIYHLAAQSYVPFSFNSPLSTLNANVLGTANLLEAIRTVDIDPVIHICSSSEVYGQVKKTEVPITEECPLRPQSPYGVSKVGEDMLGYQYYCSYGMKTIRTRMFTHTGPRRGDVFVVSAFAKQIAAMEKGILAPVLKVGNLDSIRTFADVRDAVKAYWLLTEKCPAGEVYNIGGNNTMSIRDMLKKLLKMTDMSQGKIKVRVDKSLFRPSDVTLQIPCTDKFRKATGWKPKIPFEKTLLDTLNYWREQE